MKECQVTNQTPNMPYNEIVLPAGTFRMYADRPNVWIQILKSGDKSVVDRIEDDFNSGNIKNNS